VITLTSENNCESISIVRDTFGTICGTYIVNNVPVMLARMPSSGDFAKDSKIMMSELFIESSRKKEKENKK